MPVGALCAMTAVSAKEGGNTPALAGAIVTLQQGLITGTDQSKPISAKYEIDEGTFQLSIYTEKAGKFSEISSITQRAAAGSEALSSPCDSADALKSFCTEI